MGRSFHGVQFWSFSWIGFTCETPSLKIFSSTCNFFCNSLVLVISKVKCWSLLIPLWFPGFHYLGGGGRGGRGGKSPVCTQALIGGRPRSSVIWPPPTKETLLLAMTLSYQNFMVLSPSEIIPSSSVTSTNKEVRDLIKLKIFSDKKEG